MDNLQKRMQLSNKIMELSLLYSQLIWTATDEKLIENLNKGE